MQRIKNSVTVAILIVAVLMGCRSKEKEKEIPEVFSIVPETPSTAPDYFCTWNIQGFVDSYLINEWQRAAMNEVYMFGEGPYQNWVEFYPKIREDLIFVMDDSWDIPQDENAMNDNDYLGVTELDTTRFPSYTGTPTERLKKLVDSVESKGWRGLGGWICAQEAPIYGSVEAEPYWIERLKAAHEAGFDYWKVDWGKEGRNGEWRKKLTELGRTHAPDLIIEHAMKEEFIKFSDVYRTYDVENVISQPVTLQRIASVLKFETEDGAKGLINSEDEPYIAVGLGTASALMRHPFNDTLPDGQQDFVFPPVGRDILHRMDESIRGIRWRRIAQPFGVGEGTHEVDDELLTDYWIMGERETWCLWCEGREPGDTLVESAPARISRNLPLPIVAEKNSEKRPFVLASEYLNGASAIVTVGRGLGREYLTEPVNVTQQLNHWDKPIGIFGYFKNLTLILPEEIQSKNIKVFAQDLADNQAIEITERISINGNKVSLSGDVIREVGLSAASSGDKSDPGMVMLIKKLE